jgi:hypothetical protein
LGRPVGGPFFTKPWTIMEYIRDWSCDGDSCIRSQGEVRLYPLDSAIDVSFRIRSQGKVRDCPVGSTTELVLCRVCWERANCMADKSGLPPVNWHECEVHIWTPESKPGQRRYDHVVQEAAWNALRDGWIARRQRQLAAA